MIKRDSFNPLLVFTFLQNDVSALLNAMFATRAVTHALTHVPALFPAFTTIYLILTQWS